MDHFRKEPCQAQPDASMRTRAFARARRYVIEQHRRDSLVAGETKTHRTFMSRKAYAVGRHGTVPGDPRQ